MFPQLFFRIFPSEYRFAVCAAQIPQPVHTELSSPGRGPTSVEDAQSEHGKLVDFSQRPVVQEYKNQRIESCAGSVCAAQC